VAEAGDTIPGASGMVFGDGAVLFSAESRHLERVPRCPSEARYCPSVDQCLRVRAEEVSVMWSAQWAALSSTTSRWQARVRCTLRVQKARRVDRNVWDVAPELP
jgi:hypothetical protein